MSNRERMIEFVDTFRHRARELWTREKLLESSGRRAGASPVMKFYGATVCTQARLAGGDGRDPNVVVRDFLDYVRVWERSDKEDFRTTLRDGGVARRFEEERRADDAERIRLARARNEKDPEPQYTPEDYARIAELEKKRLRRAGEPATVATEMLTNLDLSLVPGRAVGNGSLAAQYEPPEEAWEVLATRLAMPDTDWCSPLFSYWLDEAGVPWALERLVDRIENGIVRTTIPLRNVRVSEGTASPGEAADIAHDFAVSWQKGDLAGVDERRKLYAALFGFPLYCAARWGTLETVDPRHDFPTTFHRFLNEAMRFYADRRNRLVEPDARPVKMALEDLSRVLREGSENLRRNVSPEIRGQMEYTLACLGGDGPPFTPVAQPDAYDQLREDWARALSFRPGLEKVMRPWELACDAVAALYQWKRPHAHHFRTLAECGELLLTVTGAVYVPGRDLTDDESLALLIALRGPVTEYVQSYKVVTQVDLEKQALFGPPAQALSQVYQPPVVPPLRRLWAEVPANL